MLLASVLPPYTPKSSIDKKRKAKKLYEATSSLSEYIELLNESNSGATHWLDCDTMYTSYPVCYCSYLKRLINFFLNHGAIVLWGTQKQ